MSTKGSDGGVRGVGLVNLQKQYVVRASSLSAFLRDLKRRLRLGSKEFNVCFVDDQGIRQLNLAYRGKDKATDVLSFPWAEAGEPLAPEARDPSRRHVRGGITNFLGDVVISAPTARRHAREEGHSTLNEIRWLILHGLLHLLGYDHERDSGEMMTLELALRDKLGVGQGGAIQNSRFKIQDSKGKRQRSKGKSQMARVKGRRRKSK